MTMPIEKSFLNVVAPALIDMLNNNLGTLRPSTPFTYMFPPEVEEEGIYATFPIKGVCTVDGERQELPATFSLPAKPFTWATAELNVSYLPEYALFQLHCLEANFFLSQI